MHLITVGISIVVRCTFGHKYSVKFGLHTEYYPESALEQDSNSAPSKQEVYESYERFCNANKLAVESEQSFSRRLKKQYGFKDLQMRNEKCSGRSYFWVGIKLKDWKAAEEGQSNL
jgi:hypothetical protein